MWYEFLACDKKKILDLSPNSSAKTAGGKRTACYIAIVRLNNL